MKKTLLWKRGMAIALVALMMISFAGCGRLANAISAFVNYDDSTEEVENTENSGNSLVTNDPDTGNTNSLFDNNSINVNPSESTESTEGTSDNTITLEQISHVYYEFLLPQGWSYEVDTVNDFSLHAFDPSNPEMGFYFIYWTGPFLKDASACQYFTDSHFTTAVAFDEPKMNQFYYNWNDAMAYSQSFGMLTTFPQMNNVSIIREEACTTMLSSVATDESIAEIQFESENGVACTGLCSGTLVSEMDYYMGNVNCGFYGVHNAYGMMAPTTQYEAYQDMLQQCLSSITLTQEFADYHAAVSQNTIDAGQAAQSASQAAFDAYLDAWAAD